MQQHADDTRLHLGDFFIISALATLLTCVLALHFVPDPAAQLQEWVDRAALLGARAAAAARGLLLLLLALLAALAQ